MGRNATMLIINVSCQAPGLASALGGKFSGIHWGRLWIESRACCEVGMLQAWKNGPRFLPMVWENRTIHWSRFWSSDFGLSLLDSCWYCLNVLTKGSQPNAFFSWIYMMSPTNGSCFHCSNCAPSAKRSEERRV